MSCCCGVRHEMESMLYSEAAYIDSQEAGLSTYCLVCSSYQIL
jgi:hypothetical protein